jgi:site-specific recombinase XerD
MSQELPVREEPQPPAMLDQPAHLVVIPATMADAGDDAAHRFFEFFTANIRNPNTRRAYLRASLRFFAWTQRHRLTLRAIRPPHVAAYVEELLAAGQSRPSVKQALAALKMLFDFLVVGQVVPSNPAASVRGPKHVVRKGTTPVLARDEMRDLLSSIDTSHVVGLRDRALIGLMAFSFARIGAAVSMRVEDYYPQGKRWWLRLHEKGGKLLDMPAHHTLESYLDAYIEAAGIRDKKKSPLFLTANRRTKRLTTRAMTEKDAWKMVRRRAKDAGIKTPRIGCHTFRATGITNYLENGGRLEKAQQMASHESAKTTKLYDRTSDTITLDEVERIRFDDQAAGMAAK